MPGDGYSHRKDLAMWAIAGGTQRAFLCPVPHSPWRRQRAAAAQEWDAKTMLVSVMQESNMDNDGLADIRQSVRKLCDGLSLIHISEPTRPY